MMTGALTNDQPTRLVRFEDQDRNADRNLGGRDGQAGQGTKQKKKTEKLLRNAYWFIFCCGLCEEWDLAADSRQHGVQSMVVRGGERPYGGCLGGS